MEWMIGHPSQGGHFVNLEVQILWEAQRMSYVRYQMRVAFTCPFICVLSGPLDIQPAQTQTAEAMGGRTRVALSKKRSPL